MKIVVAQHKGGVGKTTLATHIAGFLSEDELDKLLLIDCDSQGDSFRFYSERLPEKDLELVEGNYNVDVLWNPDRVSLSTKDAYSGYDHIVVDIDTKIQNALQVIVELNPDLILLPIDDQYLSVTHLIDALSLVSQVEGKVSYPATVKIVQMGSEHDLERLLNSGEVDLPSDVYIGYKLPYLRREFNKCMEKCELIWNLDPTQSSIKELIEELV